MTTILRIVQTVVFALLLALSAFTTSAAYAQVGSRVVVPDRPQAPAGNGCYQITERVYGPYTMSFCLTNRGSYRVTGGGLSCNGGLVWNGSGRTIDIRLQRTSCGGGKAWSADRLSCQSTGFFGDVSPRVVIPDMPGLSTLRCTYTPSARGYKPTTVRARRTS